MKVFCQNPFHLCNKKNILKISFTEMLFHPLVQQVLSNIPVTVFHSGVVLKSFFSLHPSNISSLP